MLSEKYSLGVREREKEREGREKGRGERERKLTISHIYIVLQSLAGRVILYYIGYHKLAKNPLARQN